MEITFGVQCKINEFLQEQGASLAPTTSQTYRHALNAFLNFAKSSRLTLPITKDALAQYTDTLTSQGKSGNSIQQYMTILKIFLRWNETPVEFTYKIPSAEKKKQKLKSMSRWFTENEIQLCIEYRFPCNHIRNHLITRLLIETGARVREVANVATGDIDLPNGMIWLKDSKTEPRAAFFSSETKQGFKRFLASGVRTDLFNKSTRLFPSVPQVKRIINDMLKDLGLKPEAGKDGRGPHTFRHYCATYLHYIGKMELNDVAVLLGDSPDMIRDRYLHPTPDMLRDRIGKAMNWNIKKDDSGHTTGTTEQKKEIQQSVF